MEFNNFAGRIKSLLNLDTFQKPPATYKEVSRFTDFQGEMVKKTVQKTEFSQLNDKGFYFHDGIMSLPYGHQNLKEIDDFKKEKGQKIEKYFWEEKEKLLSMEKKALKNTLRLYLYHQILMSQPKIFDIKQKGNFESQNKKLIRRNTKDNSIRRMDEIKYMYDGKLEGNILDVGRTGCGKNTFVQNLGKNKMFGDVKEVYWMSNIELSKAREENIRDCFVNQIVKFDYPNNVEEFDDLLQAYRLRYADYIENDLGENMVLDKLIVMDDVSELADSSDEFANFLTVSRKYDLTCVYIFHMIYPTRQNWRK